MDNTTDINNQFDEFQEFLSREEQHLKYRTLIDVPDEFFNLINDLSQEISLSLLDNNDEDILL